MPCGQGDDLFSPICQERIGGDYEGTDAVLGDRREGAVDLVWSGGIQNYDLQVEGARSFLQFGRLSRRLRIVRIEKQGDDLGIGDQIVQQREPLRSELSAEPTHPGDIPPWLVQARDKAVLAGVVVVLNGLRFWNCSVSCGV